MTACREGIALRIRVPLSPMMAGSAHEDLLLVGRPENKVGTAACQTHWAAAFGTNHLLVGSEKVCWLLLLKRHDFTRSLNMPTKCHF
jgi:hypothetical protein